MRGVFLDADSLYPEDLELATLRNCIDDWQFYGHTEPDEIDKRISGARIVVTNKVPMMRETLLRARDLRLICIAATGTNNVDISAAVEAGIIVSNARDYATASVTEAVFSLILTLTRRLDSYRARVAEGAWPKSQHFCLFGEPIGELHGKTLGIIGYGTLGRAVEQAAAAFSMNVQICQRLHAAPESGRTPLQGLLSQADVISLHCPLSEHTRNLIGRPELRAMKSGALLINTARGGIVDEAALVEALQQGWIAGAAIDVLSEEPPVSGNPLLSWQSPRLIVTPHVAWASRPARQRLVNEIVENIRAFQRAGARNKVC